MITYPFNRYGRTLYRLDREEPAIAAALRAVHEGSPAAVPKVGYLGWLPQSDLVALMQAAFPADGIDAQETDQIEGPITHEEMAASTKATGSYRRESQADLVRSSVNAWIAAGGPERAGSR